MKPTPMHAYQSVTTTRVMPPQPPTKPPAYAARIAQHIAMGKTPAQAMQAIERADGHMGRVPPSAQPENVGGRGTPRPGRQRPVADQIMLHITAEWQAITPELCAAVGAHHESIRNTLNRLLAIEAVENQPGAKNRPTKWRLAQ